MHGYNPNRASKRKWPDQEEKDRQVPKRQINYSLATPRNGQRRILLRAEGTRSDVLKRDFFFSNTDVVSHIAAFLDIKSLSRFVSCSKRCMEILRPDHVVRAALYQGGHAKTNLERMIGMIRGNHILVPSALRLLRLCIGRLCECCQRKRVNFVSQHFGVFFCKECLDKEGYVATLRRFDPMYPHVAHLYVIPEGCHTLKVWGETLCR